MSYRALIFRKGNLIRGNLGQQELGSPFLLKFAFWIWWATPVIVRRSPSILRRWTANGLKKGELRDKRDLIGATGSARGFAAFPYEHYRRDMYISRLSAVSWELSEQEAPYFVLMARRRLWPVATFGQVQTTAVHLQATASTLKADLRMRAALRI